MKREERFFSVVVPVYNVEAYLERCVKSLLNQNYQNYEIILVNDGSTDRSGQLCDEYAQNHEKISVVHKVNGGLSSARNVGFEHTNGEYVLFIDSDDWIEHNALELLNKAIHSAAYPVDIVKYNYIRHTEKDMPCLCDIVHGLYIGDEIDTLLEKAFFSVGNYSLSVCTHAYRRAFIDNNVFVPEREVGSEDFLFNLKALLDAKSVLVLEQALYHYDLRMGSLTQRYREKLFEKYTKLFLELKTYLILKNKYDKYFRKLSYFYIWTLIYGTGFTNEYRITSNHSLTEGRVHVKQGLGIPEVQQALKDSDKKSLNWRQKVQLVAMQLKIESLFYWLFVVKVSKTRK